MSPPIYSTNERSARALETIARELAVVRHAFVALVRLQPSPGSHAKNVKQELLDAVSRSEDLARSAAGVSPTRD